MKRIIFGDIHGNYLSVESILTEVDYNPAEDIIICVGDYCDHFPQHTTRNVKKTLDLLCDLHEEAPDLTFFVLGNHDLWFRDWVDTNSLPQMIWYSQGGHQTLSSYLGREVNYNLISVMEASNAIPTRHKSFLFNLLQYYVDDKVVCVHGGFPYDVPEQLTVLQAVRRELRLSTEQENDVLWDRSFWHGSVAQKDRFRDQFGNRYMITGHTQVRYSQMAFEPIPGPFVNEKSRKWINIDSPGLHAVVIHNDTYKIVGQNTEWDK